MDEIDSRHSYDFSTTVETNAAYLTASSRWPGSDIPMQLTSPSGRVITRTTEADDVTHQKTATSELFSIRNPEPGSWTISLYGADVDPQGEEAQLRIYTPEVENQAPIAHMTQTPAATTSTVTVDPGTTIRYDGSGSTDSDGTITSYQWMFADGASETAAATSHTWTTAGTYEVSLMVTDDDGAMGFAEAPTVTVRPYDFSGFLPPVGKGNSASKAGQAIPIKWTLRDSTGSAVTDLAAVKSYDADAPGGTYTLGIDPVSKQFTLLAKTPKAWAGQTRTITVTLLDGTRHSATFTFKP